MQPSYPSNLYLKFKKRFFLGGGVADYIFLNFPEGGTLQLDIFSYKVYSFSKIKRKKYFFIGAAK